MPKTIVRARMKLVLEELVRKDRPLEYVYHAGRNKITRINKSMLGQRDEGFYGEGFYVSDEAEYVQKWYGPVVTAFKVRPTAKILRASVDMKSAPKQLSSKIKGFLKKMLRNRGLSDEYESQLKLIRENQREWGHMVDMYAEEKKYDLIVYNSYEIVVKNLDILSKVWSGEEERRKYQNMHGRP